MKLQNYIDLTTKSTKIAPNQERSCTKRNLPRKSKTIARLVNIPTLKPIVGRVRKARERASFGVQLTGTHNYVQVPSSDKKEGKVRGVEGEDWYDSSRGKVSTSTKVGVSEVCGEHGCAGRAVRDGAAARMRVAADLGAVQRAPLPRRKHPPRTPGEQVALAPCLGYYFWNESGNQVFQCKVLLQLTGKVFTGLIESLFLKSCLNFS